MSDMPPSVDNKDEQEPSVRKAPNTPPLTPFTNPELRDTPVSGRKLSTVNHTNLLPAGTKSRMRMAQEMERHLKEVEYDAFVDLMLNESHRIGPHLNELPQGDGFMEQNFPIVEIRETDFTVKEEKIYFILCRLIQAAFELASRDNLLENGLVVLNTSSRKETSQRSQASENNNDRPDIISSPLKPDLSVFRRMDTRHCRASRENGPREVEVDPNNTDPHQWDGRILWELVKLFLEVKTDQGNNPFGVGPRQGFLPISNGATETRGQIAQYASETRIRQHRVFALSVSIFRNTARLIRWDQVGAIVSEPIDFTAEPWKFLRFLYYVGQMTDVQLGWDPTVVPATEPEVELWNRCASTKEKALRTRLDNAFSNELDRFKVKVNGDDIHHAKQRWEAATGSQPSQVIELPPSECKEFLIGRLCSGQRSPTGRGTRGYIALDLGTNEFVFMKDSWRPDHREDGATPPDPEPEMVTYARLHEAGVEYIADVICGGDVYSDRDVLQRTCNHRYLDEYRARIHTRMVIKQVGRPLEDYSQSKELVVAVHGALLAHRGAWEKAEILHRDISDGNIVIDDSLPGIPKGLLIDWDLCKKKKLLGEGATNADRSGTWAFLSAALLNWPKKDYEVSDDLESFVHLLVWLFLRFHSHGLSGHSVQLSNHLTDKYLHSELTPGGYHIGSHIKLVDVLEGRLGILPYKGANSPAFLDHIYSLLALLKDHYNSVDPYNMEAVYGSNPDRYRDHSLPPIAVPSTPSMEQHSTKKDSFISKQPDTSLGTHNRMIALFNIAMEKTGPQDWTDDKVKDQFKDLRMFPVASESGTTSQHTGSKRNSERDSGSLRGAGKRKKVQGDEN